MKTWTRIKTIIASISTFKSIYIFKTDRILVALLERERPFTWFQSLISVMSICSDALTTANEFSSAGTFRIRERSTLGKDWFSESFFIFDRPALRPLEVDTESSLTLEFCAKFELLFRPSVVWRYWSLSFEKESWLWRSIGFRTMWMFSPLWSCCNKFSSTYKRNK